ncbi:MAG: hypothetical protein ACLP50_09865 [Solirubrobacteraceae bacterium]
MSISTAVLFPGQRSQTADRGELVAHVKVVASGAAASLPAGAEHAHELGLWAMGPDRG